MDRRCYVIEVNGTPVSVLCPDGNPPTDRDRQFIGELVQLLKARAIATPGKPVWCCDEFRREQCVGECVQAPGQRTNQERREEAEKPGASLCSMCGGTGRVPHETLPCHRKCSACDGLGVALLTEAQT